MRKKQQKNIYGKIANIIVYLVLFCCLYFAYEFYQTNNFNEFVRTESNLYTSKFLRDNDTKYSKQRSYKIQSEEFNDAMFCKTINVKKNSSYKVTCMVKTNEVQAQEDLSGVGAQIAIEDTTERSNAITGTQDWQKLEFIFNSKDREKVNIAFRLGGYIAQAKGEVWFSDFTIEEGLRDESTEWNFACFIFENTDVNINGKQIQLNVTSSDILDITNTINGFEDTCYELSKGKMTAKCDIYNIATPISKLSYDEKLGYYVSASDVEEQIKDTITGSNYDHIFVVVRLGDEEHNDDIQINDWIGLRFNGLLWNWIFKYKVTK